MMLTIHDLDTMSIFLIHLFIHIIFLLGVVLYFRQISIKVFIVYLGISVINGCRLVITSPFKYQLHWYFAVVISALTSILLGAWRYERLESTKKGRELVEKLRRDKIEILNGNVKLQEVNKKLIEVGKEYDVDCV